MLKDILDDSLKQQIWIIVSFLIMFMLGALLIGVALGFYFGYDWASDYCYDIIQDCVDKLQATPLGAFVTEEYRTNLTEMLGEDWVGNNIHYER